MNIIHFKRHLNRMFILVKFLPCKWCCRRRIIYVIALVLSFSIFLLLITLKSYNTCSFREVQRAVDTICDNYLNREALGNICADLCELNTLRANACLSHHTGKDVVFQAHYFNDRIIIKSTKLDVEEFDQIYYSDSDGSKVHPTLNMFFSIVADSLHKQLGVNITTQSMPEMLDHLTKLWSRNLHHFQDLPVPIQDAAKSNIWFLIQQTEYLLMKFYENWNIFPKIIGTCGHFYAVEYIQPLDNHFAIFYPAWKQDFPKRADLALKLLRFLEDTEQNFPFLHFCDVKVGHFGLDKSENVKILDLDMILTETSLIENFVATSNCTDDYDCAFFDCLAQCDTKEQKCIPRVVDNNFLRICRNILSGKMMGAYLGLLGSPPRHISTKLNQLLQRCSEQLDDKTSHILASELKHLLESVF